MSPQQRDAVLQRDWIGMLRLGGTFITPAGYFRWHQYAGDWRAHGRCARCAFKAMMINGGRYQKGVESQWLSCSQASELLMPGIGAAVDHKKTQTDYWKPLFDGYEPARKWMRNEAPDVV